MNKLYFVLRTRGLSAVIRATSRELFRLWFQYVLRQRFVQIRVFDFRLTIDLFDTGISRTLWLFGKRELDHKWIMEKTLRPGAKVLDIGANIGYYALIEKGLIGPTGSILAVEPVRANLTLLRKNCQKSEMENVTIVEGAVSNVAGQRSFYIAEESNLNTFHKHVLEARGNLRQEVTVETFTVAQLVEEHGQFDYLRMDIEGHEVEVLDDIGKLAGKIEKMPNIIFETHTKTYDSEHPISPALLQLHKCGYSVEYVASSSERGTRILEENGYRSIAKMRTDEVVRSIHQNISMTHLIACLEKTGGIRTVYLAHQRC
jgi:FkbM family methyltransferase